jgi:hypothetical protein
MSLYIDHADRFRAGPIALIGLRLHYIVYWLWNYATWPPQHLGRTAYLDPLLEERNRTVAHCRVRVKL